MICFQILILYIILLKGIIFVTSFISKRIVYRLEARQECTKLKRNIVVKMEVMGGFIGEASIS